MIRRVLTIIGLAVALGMVIWLADHFLVLDTLVEKEARLRALLDERPVRTVAWTFLVYALVSMVPGTTGKSLVIGWWFGFWLGLVVVNLGLTVASLASFGLSRRYLHDFARERFGSLWTRFNAGIARDGASYLFTARILHAPYCVTNYVMGATPIRLGSFWWATQIGLLPGNIIFVYAGSRLPTLQSVAEDGFTTLLSKEVLPTLVIASVLSLLVGWIVRRLTGKKEVEGS